MGLIYRVLINDRPPSVGYTGIFEKTVLNVSFEKFNCKSEVKNRRVIAKPFQFLNKF